MLVALDEIEGFPDGQPVSVFVRTKAGRSSVKLGLGTLRAIHEIVDRERISWDEICGLVAKRKLPKETLAEALRSYVLNYFREAATEEGHKNAGHGDRCAGNDEGSGEDRVGVRSAKVSKLKRRESRLGPRGENRPLSPSA